MDVAFTNRRMEWHALGKRHNAEPEYPWSSLRACLCYFRISRTGTTLSLKICENLDSQNQLPKEFEYQEGNFHQMAQATADAFGKKYRGSKTIG